MGDEEDRIAELHQVLDATAEFLGADELEILIEVAQGLALGQEQIGYFDVAEDDRDFEAEGDQELRDWLVYQGAAIVKMRRMRKNRG